MMVHNFIDIFGSSKVMEIFWLPLSVNIIAGILLAWLLRGKDDASRRHSGLTLNTVHQYISHEFARTDVNVHVNHHQHQTASTLQKEDPTFAIILLGLAVLTVGYVKYQDTILYYSVMAATSLFGFWLANIMFSYFSGTLQGRGWLYYLISVCVLSFLALPILYLAKQPLYVPEGIQHLQQAVNEAGMVGIISGGTESTAFVLFQVLGFVLLYGAWIFMLLVMAFMASSSLVTIEARGRSVWLWIAQRTVRFAHPLGGLAFISVLYAIAFIGISGLGVQWWVS